MHAAGKSVERGESSRAFAWLAFSHRSTGMNPVGSGRKRVYYCRTLGAVFGLLPLVAIKLGGVLAVIDFINMRDAFDRQPEHDAI